MDEFKKYLRERRDQMDIDLPADDTWDKIRRGSKKNQISIVRMLAAASVLIFIIAAVYLMAYKKQPALANVVMPASSDLASNYKTDSKKDQNISNVTTVHQPENIGIDEKVEKAPLKKNDHLVFTAHRTKIVKPLKKTESVAETFNDMQKSFAIIINMQLNKVKNTPLYAEDADYFTVFKKEFEDLNTDENNAKQEIIHNGLQDAQIGKLINVYQQKILLLKRLQSEINKVNSHAPKQQADNTQKPTYINL